MHNDHLVPVEFRVSSKRNLIISISLPPTTLLIFVSSWFVHLSSRKLNY